MRARHLSVRTERAYTAWIRRYVRYHGMRHPEELDNEHVIAFLTYLAAERRIARSTQVQAMSALTLLYADVLKKPLGDIRHVIRSTTPARLPVVLTPDEVQAMLAALEGVPKLVATLLYGSGLRLLEALTLRAKDLDLDAAEIRVRRGKGGKDRVTMLPETAIPTLREHLTAVKARHDQDLRAGNGRVQLPGALEAKSPSWGKQFGWQWVFPARRRYIDTSIPRPVRSGVTIFTNRWCSVLSRGPSVPRESQSTRAATPFATLSRRTCWRQATTFGQFRSSWATPM